jgi:sulfate transport system permease protein
MNRSNEMVKVVPKQHRLGKNTLIAAVVTWFFFMILLPVFGIMREAFREGLNVFIAALTTPESIHAFLLTLWITIATIVMNTVFGLILAITLVK